MKKYIKIKGFILRCRGRVAKMLLTIVSLLLLSSAEAQLAKVIVYGGAAAAAAILGKKKKDNKSTNNTNTNAAAQDVAQPVDGFTDDLSGTWEGRLTNGNLVMFYQINLVKTSNGTYSGFDYCRWERNTDNSPQVAPGQTPPSAKKAFMAKFDGGVLYCNELADIENSNWPLINEQLRLEKYKDTLVLINDKQNEAQRKFMLKRTGDFEPSNKQYLVDSTSLVVNEVTYNNPSRASAIKYSETGFIKVAVKSKAGFNFKNIWADVTGLETNNGIEKAGNHTLYHLDSAGQQYINIPIRSAFFMPQTTLHLNVAVYVDTIAVAKKVFLLPTNAFFKTSNVSVPPYSSPRLQAVAGYYGFNNAAYADVSKQLDPIVAAGDKIAGMWKAVFLTMGYGEYKIDEGEGYALGKTSIKAVEDKARTGDAEAMYLMFYAYQMGLEGENKPELAMQFLQKSSVAGFKPAMYDYALQFIARKDYANGFQYINSSYAAGVKRAAEMIGIMYDKGFATGQDIDSAVKWYKAGIAFGDPEAMLSYANLVAKGINNNPPDITKAVSLATAASEKNYTGAMIYLGSLYIDGRQGVAKSFPSAIKWFKAAADRGDRQAMLALGETYLSNTTGATPDEHSALFWIKKAAELGSPGAMKFLAKCYYDGTGGEKNLIAYRYWYNQAALLGAAEGDMTGLNAGANDFLNFWKYADFSPSYIYVNEYGEKVGDSGTDFFGGMVGGLLGGWFDRMSHPQEQINGLQFIRKEKDVKVYGATVSTFFVTDLYLKKGQTVNIKSYGIVSTGMFSGAATADGLGNSWAEYRLVRDISTCAVMACIKGTNKWQFIGQGRQFTAAADGQLGIAVNGIDAANYKGYFDMVIEVPESQPTGQPANDVSNPTTEKTPDVIQQILLQKASVAGLGNASSETPTARLLVKGGWYQHFEKGLVYFNPETQQPYVVVGDIFGRWGELKWENGMLGYPLSDEQDSKLFVGYTRQSEFDNGYIFWGPGKPIVVITKSAIGDVAVNKLIEQKNAGNSIHTFIGSTVRIRNAGNNAFLEISHGRAKCQQAGNEISGDWQLIDDGGRVLIKNSKTGEYLSTEDNRMLSQQPNGWSSFYTRWNIEIVNDSTVRLRSDLKKETFLGQQVQYPGGVIPDRVKNTYLNVTDKGEVESVKTNTDAMNCKWILERR